MLAQAQFAVTCQSSSDGGQTRVLYTTLVQL